MTQLVKFKYSEKATKFKILPISFHIGLLVMNEFLKRFSPFSLCKYLVKNLFRAGPTPKARTGWGKGQPFLSTEWMEAKFRLELFWLLWLLLSDGSSMSALSSSEPCPEVEDRGREDPSKLDLGLQSSEESLLWRLTLGHDKSKGCIWQSVGSVSTEVAMVFNGLFQC